MAEFCKDCLGEHMGLTADTKEGKAWLLNENSMSICEGCGYTYLKERWWLGKFSGRVCKTLDEWKEKHPDVFTIIEQHAKYDTLKNIKGQKCPSCNGKKSYSSFLCKKCYNKRERRGYV